MHKNLCATFCGKPVESVESVENAIRGSSAAGRKVTSCSSYGAPRLAHDLSEKVSKKTIGKSTVIWYNADSKGGIKMRTVNHLSIKAMTELVEVGSYDTKKYRYIIDQTNGECYRINKEYLGTTETLDPENWVKQ
jgi:hypothetical protein